MPGSVRCGPFLELRHHIVKGRVTLQLFPTDSRFMSPEEITFKSIGRMIGNAVPVRLGEIIGLSIQRHLEELERLKTPS